MEIAASVDSSPIDDTSDPSDALNEGSEVVTGNGALQEAVAEGLDGNATEGNGLKGTRGEAVQKRRAEKKAKKAKLQMEKAKAKEAQARLVAERESQPEAQLLADIQSACAKGLEDWRGSRSWDTDTVHLMDDSLMAIAKSYSPTPADTEARQDVIERVHAAVCAAFPAQEDIRVEAFGSYTSGFYNSNSDLDMSLEGCWIQDESMPELKPIDHLGDWNKNSRAKMLKKLCKVLKKARVSRGYVQIIAHARVPLLKFVDNFTGISCDLCIGNAGAAFKSHVLGFLTHVDPRFVPMTMLVKRWAKEHGINNPTMGTFNSFALTLMVTFFLQNTAPPVLPPICDLFSGSGADFQRRPLSNGPYAEAAGPQKLEAARNLAIELGNSGFGTKQSAGITELFADFIALLSAAMEWWTTEGTGVVRISAWAGFWTCRPWNQSYTIAVEDPFDSRENCARTLSTTDAADSKVVQHVVQIASWTRKTLEGIGPSTGAGLLIDALFGKGTSQGLPPVLQRKLQQQSRLLPKTSISDPPRLPEGQQDRGGLQAGDVMFRERDEWKNWTPNPKQRREAQRNHKIEARAVADEPKSNRATVDRSEEFSGHDVQLLPNPRPPGMSHLINSRSSIPVLATPHQKQRARAVPFPVPQSSYRSRQQASTNARSISPSPPGFQWTGSSPPPPGFMPRGGINVVSAVQPKDRDENAALAAGKLPSAGHQGRAGRGSRNNGVRRGRQQHQQLVDKAVPSDSGRSADCLAVSDSDGHNISNGGRMPRRARESSRHPKKGAGGSINQERTVS